MITTGDIIKAAMRKIGVLAAGEPLPADEGNDALDTFTDMVDAWSNESLLIPVVGTVQKQLIQGQVEYTIGIYPEPRPDPLPANHIETSRPEKILSSFIRDPQGTDYLLEVMYSKNYSEIGRKTNEARPSRFYVREGWPLNTILFDAVPYADETLHLEVLQPLSEILPTACLTDVINLPPGYRRSIIYNLAMDLADEWGKDPSRMVAVTSVESKKWLKRNNYRPLMLRMDRALTIPRRAKGTYDINSGVS